MKRIFRKVHLWLSVPFGLIITIVCLSGACLVFEPEITALCRPHLNRVEVPDTPPLPIEQVLRNVQGSLPAGTEIKGVSISENPAEPWRVNLSQPRRAAVIVNQYTGEVLGRSERLPFFSFMFQAHRWLLDGSHSVGKTVVGISTLVFAVVLLTGIVLWWPRRRQALKSGLTISTRRGLMRFWFDLHNAGGFYAFIFLLAMALTGLTWSFGWYRTAFYALFGTEAQSPHSAPAQKGGATARGGHGKGGEGQTARHGGNGGERGGRKGKGQVGRSEKEASAGPDFTQWQKVYDQLKDRYTDYRQIAVTDGTATVGLPGLGNQRASDRYTFQPETGRLTQTTLYADTETAGKLRGWIYSVHVGSWGGWFTRILAFCAALLGASLPLTGYYLWWRRTRTKCRR